MTFMKLKLLIVEDDALLAKLISKYFSRKGWDTVIASDGDAAIELFEADAFHLILLDVMLPKQDGFTVIKKIRNKSNIPVFFITGRVMEEDELHGYELGGDDYITKPFSLHVLYAKAIAMMNRVRGNVAFQKIRKGDIEIDMETCSVNISGKHCQLPKLEYEMLLYFLENANRVLTREQLIIRLWGHDFDGNERIMDNHMKKLRKAIDESECEIKTIYKTGYMLKVKYEKA